MKYKVRIEKLGSYFQAKCSELPCMAVAKSKEEVLMKVKKEILFYLQSCPCDQVPEKAVEVEVE